MSKFDDVLQGVENDAKGFYQKLAALATKGRQAWVLISSAQTRSVMLALGQQAVKTVKDVEATIAANVATPASAATITLDGTLYQDIKTLIADAKAGDGVILSDLKVLGITL